MKQKFLSRAMSAVLAAAMLSACAVPVFASGNEKYKAEDGSLHTLRWADGISVPALPSQEEKSLFSPRKVTVEGNTFEVLEVPAANVTGIFDLKQSPREDPSRETEPDSDPSEETVRPERILDSGYLTAAANVTHWWMTENAERIGTYLAFDPRQEKGLGNILSLFDLQTAPSSGPAEESPVYELYLRVFPEETEPDLLLDFYLNGYTPSEGKPNEKGKFTPHAEGGFFHPVFGKELLTERREVTPEKIKKSIAMNYGVILRLERGEALRYVNLWGMESDDSGKICALYVTDSLDDLGLVRYETQGKDGLTVAGMDITGLYCLDLGDAFFTPYLEAHAPEADATEKGPSDETPETKPSLQWEKPTYEWSKDNKYCTATRKTKSTGKQEAQEESVTTQSRTRNQTDKNAGMVTYVAEFDVPWAETQFKNVEQPSLSAQWGKPTYEWSEDLRICTAVRTAVSDPSLKETAQVRTKSRETREPTCLAMGQTTYTADFEEEWAETQEKVLDNIEKLTPNWGPAEYQWSQDHKTCTAIRVCKNEEDGSHVQKQPGTVTYEQTRKPTSQKKGQTTYTANFSVDWAETQQETVEDVAVLAPSWGEVIYTWSEDMKTCTAVRKDRNDADHQEKAEAVVTASVTRPATCVAKGNTTYTAEFKEDWARTQTKTREDIPMKAPDWGDTSYQWSRDHRSCTATRVCRNEKNHVETVYAEVTAKRTKNPTLESGGETRYTAEFKEDWARTQTVTAEDVPPIQDLWYMPEYEWTEDLSKCTATRVNQNDEELVQTAFATITIRKTKAPTNNARGETTYTAEFREPWARTQKKVLANIPPIPGNPHGKPEPTQAPQWNAPTYEWSEDYSRCTARRTRKDDASNVDLTWAEVTRKEKKQATCSQPGEAVFTAKFSEKWAKDQVVKGKTPTLPHKLEKVEEVKATAGKAGLKAHYACTQCHKLFLDPEGKQEVTKDQLQLSTPSVSADYAILNGVPEKDHVVAIARDKLSDTMEQNPQAKGVSIAVGSFSVTYDRKDVETILTAAGDSKKLQLTIYESDPADSALTLDQIQSADRNPHGLFYLVSLSYVKNGKNVPFENLNGSTVTLPYGGTDAVRMYRVAEDGTFLEVSGGLKDGFATFQGGNGLYMLSESRPSEGGHPKSESKLGMILWTSVLIVSGLLCVGLLGFYLYQKKLQKEEAPHRFSRPADPEPEAIPEEPAPEEEEPDEDFLKDLGLDEEPVSAEELLKHMQDMPSPGVKIPEPPAGPAAAENPAMPVSPVAPKAPMQEKPTIAEKTAEAVMHKHNKQD